MSVSALPLLHPERVAKAIRWFEIERDTFDAQDITDIGDEYDTAIAALKTMRDFQRTCHLTSGAVDKAIAVRGFFDHLKELTQRFRY